MNQNRRTFLKQTAAVSAVGMHMLLRTQFDLAAETNSARYPMKVVDSHQHLWDLKRFQLPWTHDKPTMARNYGIEDYRAATAGIPIVKSVYLEVDVTPSQQQAEADYISDLCRQGTAPLAAAVISGRPASEQFSKYAVSFRDHPYIRGLRQVLHGPSTPAGYCLQPAFVDGIRLLGELGLSFDVCVRPGELNDAAKLIDACRGTFFVLDHCGNADLQVSDQSEWRRGIAAVAERKNVVVKVSGIVASATPGKWSVADLAPIVNHTLDVFGPDRVMFGGDWPVCTLGASYRQWFDALCEIVAERPEVERQKLFHDNACKHYRLG